MSFGSSSFLLVYNIKHYKTNNIYCFTKNFNFKNMRLNITPKFKCCKTMHLAVKIVSFHFTSIFYLYHDFLKRRILISEDNSIKANENSNI